MNNEVNFLDELLLEAEQKEIALCEAHYDLIVMEISNLERQIEDNFNTVQTEIEILQQWALKRNTVIKEKADFLKLKLESFIRQEGKKTIDLPHGILKLHKKGDRVEITDMDAFMISANKDLINTVPEEIRPSISKIKSFISKTGHIPTGVRFIEGKVEFSLKIKEGDK